MPREGFEPTIPVFERAKTVYALCRAADVIGTNNNLFLFLFMYRVNSYKANYRQHSVDTSNYIMDKHNLKSMSNYRQVLEEKQINAEK
jgi:hypothetical protein